MNNVNMSRPWYATPAAGICRGWQTWNTYTHAYLYTYMHTYTRTMARCRHLQRLADMEHTHMHTWNTYTHAYLYTYMHTSAGICRGWQTWGLWILICLRYLTGMHTDAMPTYVHDIPAYMYTENAYMCVYIHIHVCIYTCMYIYMYVYMPTWGLWILICRHYLTRMHIDAKP